MYSDEGWFGRVGRAGVFLVPLLLLACESSLVTGGNGSVDFSMRPGQTGPGTGSVGPGGPGLVSTSHPVLFLAPTILNNLRARAAAGSAEWTVLRTYCDAYLGGTVEWPDGVDERNRPNIGEGYQGSGYFAPLVSLSLCYQTLAVSNATRAAEYGAKAVDILVKMSEPPGTSHATDPLRDSGYGIRFYGVGMAIGFDWVYPLLTPDQRVRVYEALNRWIEAFDTGGFGRRHPQGNYFAGYYAAKGLAALATEGDNPKAPAQWVDWRDRLHGQMVQPYYAANLAGGGWPEGWNYGPIATLNMWYPIFAAQTAKGIDLVNASAPFAFPVAQGLQLMHFCWPNRKSLDDRSLQYNSDNPSSAQPFLFTAMAGLLELWQASSAPAFHRYARVVRSSQTTKADAWQEFLFWNPAAAEADFATLPLSYQSAGTQTAAMRSSWATDAVWAAFTAGPYLNNPDSGEEYFDQGSLAILRGDRQLLVNAPGALQRNTPGTSDGGGYYDLIFSDVHSGGNRSLFNIFYVNDPSPWGQSSAGPSAVQTRLSRFEDGGAYVLLRGFNLEQMYRKRSTGPSVVSWTRDVVYLRPERFVIYDRTTIASDTYDQWQAFHLGGQPTEVTAQTGLHRFDVTHAGNFAGAVTTLLPSGHGTTTVDLFGSHKIFRLEVRPPAPTTQARWLTVFDAATAPEAVATARRLSAGDGNVSLGAVTGAHLTGSTGNQVVLFGTGGATEAVSGDIEYTVPLGATTHLVTDLAPNMGYSVAVVLNGSSQTIRITAGGSAAASSNGVLQFMTGN